MSKIINTALVCTLTLSSILPAAAGKNITFTGTVLDSACTVVVNDGSATLVLGSTLASDISTKSQTGAPKTFNVKLSSCPAAGEGVPTKASVKFSGTTDVDPSYFKNDLTDTNAAKNVGVLIKDSDGQVIVNNDGNTAISLPAAGGDVELPYTASLVATADSPTKGNVSATVTYNISYQ
jgi:P pilus assembly protein, pilin FimA